MGWREFALTQYLVEKNYRMQEERLVYKRWVSGSVKEKTKKGSFYCYKNNPDNSSFDKESVDNLIELYGRYPSTTYSVPVMSVSKHKYVQEEL